MENPTTKWCLVGAFLRNIGGSIITYYMPVFFGRNYPQFKAEYSLANTLILSILGFVTSISFGILADKYEKKTLWTRSLICMIGQAVSLPLIAMATL
jgi:hypothetical protein